MAGDVRWSSAVSAMVATSRADRSGAAAGHANPAGFERRGRSRSLIPSSVMSWAARTEQRKDAGSADIGNIGATEDKLQGERLAAVTGRHAIQAGLPWMRRFAAAAPPPPACTNGG